MDQALKESKDFVTPAEAGRRIGVSKRTIHYWIEKGILKSWQTVGGHRRIPSSSVEAFLKKRQAELEGVTSDSLTILVVEDDPVFHEFYAGAVGSWELPIRLIMAEDGFDGIYKTALEKPDVIITDLKMPGMDGFKMVRALDEKPELADIRIIVITALEPHEIAHRGGLSEGIDIFGKPPPMAHLKKLIQGLVQSRNATALSRGEHGHEPTT